MTQLTLKKFRGFQYSSSEMWDGFNMSAPRENRGRALSTFWSVPKIPDPPGTRLSSAQQASLPRKTSHTMMRLPGCPCPKSTLRRNKLRKCNDPRSFSEIHANATVFILSLARQVERVVNMSTVQIISQCSNAFYLWVLQSNIDFI